MRNVINFGYGATGLVPVFRAFVRLSDKAPVVPTPIITEIPGTGAYEFEYGFGSDADSDIWFVADGGESLGANRYREGSLSPADSFLDQRVSGVGGTDVSSILAQLGLVKIQTDKIVTGGAREAQVLAAVAAVAAQVLDQQLSGHTAAGSAGAALSAADKAAVLTAVQGVATQVTGVDTKLGAPSGGTVAAAVQAVRDQLTAVRERTDRLPDDPARHSTLVATVQGVPAGVLDAAIAGHQAPGTVGAAIASGGAGDAVVAARDQISSEIDAVMDRLGAPAGASVSADVAALQVDSTIIRGKVQPLPADPASDANVNAQIASVRADTGAIKAKTDALPVDPAGQAATDVQLDAIKADTGAIRTKAAALPADPASQAAVDASIVALGASVAGDILDADLTSHATAGTVGKALLDAVAAAKDARTVLTGRWKIDGFQMTLYADDGVTPIQVFNLLGADGNPTNGQVFERAPA